MADLVKGTGFARLKHRLRETLDMERKKPPHYRHVTVFLTLHPDHTGSTVEPSPEIVCLNWDNGDTLEFYAGGHDFSVYLGENHPFTNDIHEATIRVKRGEYSDILMLPDPEKMAKPKYLNNLPDYQVWIGHGQRPSRQTVTATSHSGVIFDP
jgi:hypothetical protein